MRIPLIGRGSTWAVAVLLLGFAGVALTCLAPVVEVKPTPAPMPGEPALFNEARYARHAGLADRHAAFQDHPMALEHFPAGSLMPPADAPVD